MVHWFRSVTLISYVTRFADSLCSSMWLTTFVYVSSQCTRGFVEQRLAASIIIPYGFDFVKRGGGEWGGMLGGSACPAVGL